MTVKTEVNYFMYFQRHKVMTFTTHFFCFLILSHNHSIVYLPTVYSYDVFELDTMSCPVEFLDTVGHVSLGGHTVCLCEYVGWFVSHL
jgi:hypothetical protein